MTHFYQRFTGQVPLQPDGAEGDSTSYFAEDSCDTTDYIAAAACGVLAGLVDIFLVGSPADSALLPWTDAQVDKAVMGFADLCGWSPRQGKEHSVASAIGFLERTFPVNYDQPYAQKVPGLSSMAAKNHHMKSLAHAPDLAGLFFSLLDQFTGTSTFLSEGQLITLRSESGELQGGSLLAKLFCGTANWFGHLMSDVAGSSGAAKRGSGLVIPFYEFFQLCDFGSLPVGQYRNTVATVATKVFQEGYDARFGLTLAIPVALCDLSIRLLWVLRRHFGKGVPWSDCVPDDSHKDLRLMLLLGHAALCLLDGADALIKSGGNWVLFILRLNLIAWVRLAWLVVKEAALRLGIASPLQKQLDAYRRINASLKHYLAQLERLDYDRFRQETARYQELAALLQQATTPEALNQALRSQYAALGLALPYQGTFDSFMEDKDAVLEFK